MVYDRSLVEGADYAPLIIGSYPRYYSGRKPMVFGPSYGEFFFSYVLSDHLLTFYTMSRTSETKITQSPNVEEGTLVRLRFDFRVQVPARV